MEPSNQRKVRNWKIWDIQLLRFPSVVRFPKAVRGRLLKLMKRKQNPRPLGKIPSERGLKCGLSGTRTPNPLIKSQLLCQLS